MALRIGRLVGNGPGLWLRMQQNYDLWRTEQGLRNELEKIAPERPPISSNARATGKNAKPTHRI